MCQNSADAKQSGVGGVWTWLRERLECGLQPYLWQFLALTFAGWVNRSQQDAIKYLEGRESSTPGAARCSSPTFRQAELLFRHILFALLRNRGLISQDRIDLLLSWRHSGFSVHNHTTVYPADTEGMHKLACYLMRAPVNLSRLRFDKASGLLVYEHRAGHDIDDDALVDPLEFLARVLIHVPQPNKHLVHFYGAYANRVRSTLPLSHAPDEPSQHLPPRRALTKRWAELIYRIYDVDPLTCRCGAEMKIIAFVTEPAAIRKILDHRNHKRPRPRAPPSPGETIVH